MSVSFFDPKKLIPGIKYLVEKFNSESKELTDGLLECGITKKEMKEYEKARDRFDDIERKIWLKAYDKIDKYNKPKWFLKIKAEHSYMYFDFDRAIRLKNIINK